MEHIIVEKSHNDEENNTIQNDMNNKLKITNYVTHANSNKIESNLHVISDTHIVYNDFNFSRRGLLNRPYFYFRCVDR